MTLRSPLTLLIACVVAALFMPPRFSADAQVRRRVLGQLHSDPATGRLSLDVAVSGGVATLSGEIRSRAEGTRALAVAGRSEGVMDVIDDLWISDPVITQNVLKAFRADPSVAKIPVTVTCAGGDVTLRSNQTDDAQRRQLVQIAASVDGVVHVVDAMK